MDPIRLNETMQLRVTVTFHSISQVPGRLNEVLVNYKIVGINKLEPTPDWVAKKIEKRGQDLVHNHLNWPCGKMRSWLGAGAVVVYLDE